MEHEQRNPAGVVRADGPAVPVPPPLPASPGETVVERMVPYRNVPALVGYYLGVFSLIPFVGLPLGLAAIPLGIIGLVKRRRTPAVHGTAHAIVAILAGLFSVVVYGGFALFFLIGMIITRNSY